MNRTVPLTEAKITLHELLRELGDGEVVLTRHGRPAAVLVDYDDWVSIHETLAEYEDRVAFLETRLGDEPTIDWEKLKAEAGLLDG